MSEMLENKSVSKEKVVFGKRSQKRSRVTLIEEAPEEKVETAPEAVEEIDVEPVVEEVKEEPVFVNITKPVEDLVAEEIAEEEMEEPVEKVEEISEEETAEEVTEEISEEEAAEEKVEAPIEAGAMVFDQEMEKPVILFDEEEEDLEPIILLNDNSEEPQEEIQPISLLKEDVVDQEQEAIDLLRVDAQEDEVEYVHEKDIKFEEEDLFYEKKSFLLTQYEKCEKYLEQKSLEGYHFVRKVGKKFYFIKADSEQYYYNIAYFKDEPSDEQWDEWEKQGWKLISRTPSKKRKEAGWFFFRHKEYANEYRRTIENEEEKYNFFRKYANSCRSTLFFIFICMAVCAVTAYLQWKMSAMWIGIIACGVIFAVSFILFLIYLRMLLKNRKTAKKLRIQLRLQQRRKNFHGEDYDPETDAQLDTDWNELESEKQGKKKRKK